MAVETTTVFTCDVCNTKQTRPYEHSRPMDWDKLALYRDSKFLRDFHLCDKCCATNTKIKESVIDVIKKFFLRINREK